MKAMPRHASRLSLPVLWAVCAGGALAGEAGAAAGPQRSIGVVRIEQILQRYEYLTDRQASIREQMANDENNFNRLLAKLQELDNEEQKARQQLAPNSPKFQEIELDRTRLLPELQILQRQLDEKVRRLSVEMLQDVYKYINFACRGFGSRYSYMLILTALDDKMPDPGANADQLTPQNVLNDILIRSVQWVHPQCDVTAFILNDLNERYRAHKADRNQPIYPATVP